MTTVENVKRYANTEWTFTDFFYAYCAAKGIDDPEEDLTEDEYFVIEKECEEKLCVSDFCKFRDKMIAEGNEILYAMMERLVRNGS